MLQALRSSIKKWLASIDWKLLLLLVFFLNVKMAVKLAALILLYLIDFRFYRRTSWRFFFKVPDIPLFYLLILLLACFQLVWNQGYADSHRVVLFLHGCLFWLLAFFALYQVNRSIAAHETATIHRTLILFFCLNGLFSAYQLLSIVAETGAINPYRYQGEHQKYFIGTGDYIKGITFDISTTNAILNAAGLIYFLVKKHYRMTLFCMAILLLSGSNFINIITVLLLLYLVLFQSTREQKSVMVLCVLLLVLFISKVSPQNEQYIGETMEAAFRKHPPSYPPYIAALPLEQRPDSVLTEEERKEKFARLYLDSLSLATALKEGKKESALTSTKPILRSQEGAVVLPTDDIHSEPFQSIKTATLAEQPLLAFIQAHRRELPFSGLGQPIPPGAGKLLAFKQSFRYLRQHPRHLLFGAGMGNFSSKLAFRATGLQFAGGYPSAYTFIHPDFLRNHLDLYLYYFSKQSSLHSLTNNPFATYDQLFTEYGLIGFLLFLVCYVGFYLKHYRRLQYGMPILLLMLLIFLMDYWFEQLSVLVLLELLLLLDIRENKQKALEEPVYA